MRSFPHAYAKCLDCGHSSPAFELLNCPVCNSQWLEAQYDYAALAVHLPGLLSRRSFNLWRYRELLPVREYQADLSFGEGGTPLIRAVNLGMMLGCPNIFIKDERQGPTSSFKDRQAAVNIAAIKEAGIKEFVLASTGNVAISYSAYAARAGVKLWAFLTSLVPAEKMREVALYGTQVVKVTASYDQVKTIAAEFARERNLYLERGARSIPSVEAMKTIAYEIVEQITERCMGQPEADNIDPRPMPWTAPDWYFQSISGGLGPLGVLKGFLEMHKMGWIETIPAIAGIQTEGCAPMVSAWKSGREQAEPVLSPRTHIATLSTGNPGRAYTLLRQRMLEHAAFTISDSGGMFESVTDEEAFRAMHILAKMEGLSVEPAAAVAFAGLIKLVRQGIVKPDHLVVVNCTGHTMPIESAVLGEDWTRNIALPTQVPQTIHDALATPPLSEAPQPVIPADPEGLLAALSRVTDDRFPNILIVDDIEEARRLIRRILQAFGNYNLIEASDGYQAIDIATRQTPDLIILDLMMPGLDGFAVIDALKADPKTAPIPIIVVTAKELTADERARLSGQIQALKQKGHFMSDDLWDEVRSLVN